MLSLSTVFFYRLDHERGCIFRRELGGIQRHRVSLRQVVEQLADFRYPRVPLPSVGESRSPFRAEAQKRRFEMSERQSNGVAIVVPVADPVFGPEWMPLDTGQRQLAPKRRRRS